MSQYNVMCRKLGEAQARRSGEHAARAGLPHTVCAYKAAVYPGLRRIWMKAYASVRGGALE